MRIVMVYDAITGTGTIIEVQGRPIKLDEQGHVSDIDLWSESFAQYVSKRDNLGLTNDYWEVIRFVRCYYMTYGIAPMPGVIVKGLNRERESMKYSVRYLYQLFPRTPVRLACKYAGIPEPSECT